MEEEKKCKEGFRGIHDMEWMTELRDKTFPSFCQVSKDDWARRFLVGVSQCVVFEQTEEDSLRHKGPALCKATLGRGRNGWQSTDPLTGARSTHQQNLSETWRLDVFAA